MTSENNTIRKSEFIYNASASSIFEIVFVRVKHEIFQIMFAWFIEEFETIQLFFIVVCAKSQFK